MANSSQMNPWDVAPTPTPNSSSAQDPITDVIKKGYQKGVEQGVFTPEEGLQRLKAQKLVHPDAKPQDLLPTEPTPIPEGWHAPMAPPKGASAPQAWHAPMALPKEEQPLPSGWHAPMALPQAAPAQAPAPAAKAPLPPPPVPAPGTGIGMTQNTPVYTKDHPERVIKEIPAAMKAVKSYVTPPAGTTPPPPAPGSMRDTFHRLLNDPGAATGMLGNGKQTNQSTTDTTKQNQTDTEKDQSTYKGQFTDYDQADNNLKQAMGYHIRPVLDENGKQVRDPETGKPAFKADDTPDPSHPYQMELAQLNKYQALLDMQDKARADRSTLSQVDLSPGIALGEIMTGKPGGLEAYQKSTAKPKSFEQEAQEREAQQGQLMKDNIALSRSVYDNLRTIHPTLTYGDLFGGSSTTGNSTTHAVTNGVKQGMPLNQLLPLLRLAETDRGKDQGDQKIILGQQGMSLKELQQALGIVNQGRGERTGDQKDYGLGQGNRTRDQGDARIMQTGAISAQKQFDTDPVIDRYQQRLDGADKIVRLLNAASNGDVKENKAILEQLNAEIGRLETGAQSADAGIQRTSMHSTAAYLKDLVDTMSGGVTSADLAPKFAQAYAMVGDLRDSYYGSIRNRQNVITRGALPTQRGVFEGKTEEYKKQYQDAPKPAVRPGYDGSVKLPDPTEAEKKMRLEWLDYQAIKSGGK